MGRLGEAMKKLQWCLEREKVDLEARIDGEHFDKNGYRVSFHKLENVMKAIVPYPWLDDCIPDEGLVTGEMRGLLKRLRRILSMKA